MTDAEVAARDPQRASTGFAARWDARVHAARERLRTRRPRLAARLDAAERRTVRLIDAVLPRRRVRAVVVAMLLATALDSVATYLWVRAGLADEGNPLVAGVMGWLGEGPALLVRALASATLIALLGWLATRHVEARGGLAIAATLLAAVTLVHLYGLVLATGLVAV